MKPKPFIRGGWDQGFGRYDRYPINDRITVFEAVLALGADTNPNSPIIASLYGSLGGRRLTTLGDVMKLETVEGMENRKRAIEGWSAQGAALYHQMEAEYKAGHFTPERMEYCADSPGTPDFTRCVYSLDQVQQLTQRRGDEGWLIRKLFTEKVASIPPVPGSNTTEATAEDVEPWLSALPRTGSLSQFVKEYVTMASQPTQRGLEVAWKKVGRDGHREELRAAFKNKMGDSAPRRGRPKKNRQN
jgi:hypothetical protein